MIPTDNTTVFSYINKQGGNHSPTLLRLVLDPFLYLQTQDIVIRARHIPGCLNVIADRLSRPNQPKTTEWSLHPEIVTRIFGSWETPTVEIFATSSLVYVSDSGASSTGDRCSVTGLAGAIDVHVTTIPLAQQSHSATTGHPGWQDNSNNPLVAITTVVPTSTSSVCVDHPGIIP